MKILYVTNMYPAENDTYGIFVKEQIDEIKKDAMVEADIYYINAAQKGNLAYLRSIFYLPKKIARHKYDIVHIHYGLSGLFLLFSTPVSKIFLTLHGADILKSQKKFIQVALSKKILKKVDKAFILNEEMEKAIEPLHIDYELLPCGVDTCFFKPGQIRPAIRETRLIIFPGNPEVEVKNYPLFKKVIDHLKKHSPLKIATGVVNKLTREGVRDLLNQGDCLLMTSFSEGSPQVVKEALACDLAVVSVPVGDIRSMLEDIPGCFISGSYHAEELAELVEKALYEENKEIRKNFIRKKIYDNKYAAKRIMENYKEILAPAS